MRYFKGLVVLCTAASVTAYHDRNSTHDITSLVDDKVYPRTRDVEPTIKSAELQRRGGSSDRPSSKDKRRSTDQVSTVAKTKKVEHPTISARPRDALSTGASSPKIAVLQPPQPSIAPPVSITGESPSKEASYLRGADVSSRKGSTPRKSSSRRPSSLKGESPPQKESSNRSGAREAKKMIPKGIVADRIAFMQKAKTAHTSTAHKDYRRMGRSKSLPSGDDIASLGDPIAIAPVKSIQASTRSRRVEVGAPEVQSGQIAGNTETTGLGPGISKATSSRPRHSADDRDTKRRHQRPPPLSTPSPQPSSSSSSRDSTPITDVRRQPQSRMSTPTPESSHPDPVAAAAAAKSNRKSSRLRTSRDRLSLPERQSSPEVVDNRSPTPSQTSKPAKSAFANLQVQASARVVPLPRWSRESPDNPMSQLRRSGSLDSNPGTGRPENVEESSGSPTRELRPWRPPQRPIVQYMSRQSGDLDMSSDSSTGGKRRIRSS